MGFNQFKNVLSTVLEFFIFLGVALMTRRG